MSMFTEGHEKVIREKEQEILRLEALVKKLDAYVQDQSGDLILADAKIKEREAELEKLQADFNEVEPDRNHWYVKYKQAAAERDELKDIAGLAQKFIKVERALIDALEKAGYL